jgi:hypothetical protein
MVRVASQLDLSEFMACSDLKFLQNKIKIMYYLILVRYGEFTCEAIRSGVIIKAAPSMENQTKKASIRLSYFPYQKSKREKYVPSNKSHRSETQIRKLKIKNHKKRFKVTSS